MLKHRGTDLQPEHPFDWLRAAAAVGSLGVLLTGAFVAGRLTASPGAVQAAAPVPPAPPVQQVVTAPPPLLPAVQPVSIANPDPNWLAEPDGVVRLLDRIEATGPVGRYKFLNVGTDRTAVALVEAGPGQLDSIAISWGHTIRQPVAMDAEEREALESQLFELTADDVRGIPEMAAHIARDAEPGASVAEVRLHAIASEPHIEYHLEHPRNVLEPVHFPL